MVPAPWLAADIKQRGHTIMQKRCRALTAMLPLLMLVTTAAGARAQPQQQPSFVLPPIEQQLQRIQEGFRKAKTPKEIQSVKLYCRDTISAYSFKDREGLMMQGLSLMQQNEIAEANKVLAHVAELEKLDANLAALTCKAPGE